MTDAGVSVRARIDRENIADLVDAENGIVSRELFISEEV